MSTSCHQKHQQQAFDSLVQGLPDDDGNEPLLLQLLRQHARNMQLQQQLAAPAAAAVVASDVSKPHQQLSTVSSGPGAASIGQQQQQPVSTLDADLNGACLQSAEDEDYDAVFVRLSYIEGPKQHIIHMRIAKLCAVMPVVAHTSEPIIKASGLHTSRLCSVLGN
jgi:hypothetical protein